MTPTPTSARTATRCIHGLIVASLIAVIALITVALGHQAPESVSLSASASETASPVDTPPGEHRGLGEHHPASEHRGPLGAADGVVPDGVTVFDDAIPAVHNLDPDLLAALRRAAADAADEGVEFYVNSGWRSPEYQERLFQEAVAKYGSEDAAARWVATPDTSPHVSGDAVDIGKSNATAWLSHHGAEYGLCRIYRNEPWHYELRTGAIGHGCPRMYADASQDPRLQR